jgi:hypothetical protein
MANEAGTLTKCCFSNIQLPLTFKRDANEKQQGEFEIGDVPKIQNG